MTIRPFEPEDLPALHRLLTSNHWDYFLDPVINEHGLKKRDVRHFMSDASLTLVGMDDEENLAGYIHFEGIKNTANDSPSFTIGVDASARRKGIGRQLLKDGLATVFDRNDKIRRIYATTREDNIPMQKLFESVGFRQEARHAKEWEDRATGTFVDALGYALLREEFESNPLNRIS